MTVNGNKAKVYQWVIGVLVGVLLFGAGWGFNQITVAQDIELNKNEILHNQKEIAKAQKSLDKYIELTTEIVENNRQLIAYLRAQER